MRLPVRSGQAILGTVPEILITALLVLADGPTAAATPPGARRASAARRRPSARPVARRRPAPEPERTRAEDLVMQVTPLPPTWTPGEPAPPPAEPGAGPEPPRGGPGRAPARDAAGLACLRELSRLGIAYQGVGATRGVTTPVRITGPLGGLKLAGGHGPRAGALMDCRFALAIHRFAPLVLRAGFDTLVYSSAYRYTYVAGTRSLSRHAAGLALDVFELHGPGGLKANVKRDWVRAASGPASCVGSVTEDRARRMRQLVCDLEASALVSMVLTPESNHAHRDHLHISGLTPGERPRRYRWCGGRASPAAAPTPPARPTVPETPPPPPDPDGETH